MRSAVHFDNNLQRHAREIGDEWTDWMLAPKTHANLVGVA
jgi:hypothetical protein